MTRWRYVSLVFAAFGLYGALLWLMPSIPLEAQPVLRQPFVTTMDPNNPYLTVLVLPLWFVLFLAVLVVVCCWIAWRAGQTRL